MSIGSQEEIKIKNFPETPFRYRIDLSIKKALHVISNYTVKVNSPGSDKSFVDYVNAHEKKTKTE